MTRIDPANRVEARRLGGFVNHGTIDPATGQRSGIRALVTPEMVVAAHARDLGSHAYSKILPPGFEELPMRARARGHLLGRQFGGSGLDERNLVTLWQYPVNDPIMSAYETLLANAIRKRGETMVYKVTPVYSPQWPTGRPSAVRLEAWGDKGFRMDVEIPNRRYVELPSGVRNETVWSKGEEVHWSPTRPEGYNGRVKVRIAPPDGYWGHESW